MNYNRYGKSIIVLLVLSLLSLGLAACTQAETDVAPEPGLEEEPLGGDEAPLDENANEELDIPDVEENANEANENGGDGAMNENGDNGNANEGTGGAAGDANVVQVTEEEFVINMPASLPAGPTSFEVTNAGTIEHNLEIEGQGIEEEFDEDLQPGETMTLEGIDLQPGTYTIYCPVGNHREQGMELELTVTG